jgi:hypothetical protein
MWRRENMTGMQNSWIWFIPSGVSGNSLASATCYTALIVTSRDLRKYFNIWIKYLKRLHKCTAVTFLLLYSDRRMCNSIWNKLRRTVWPRIGDRKILHLTIKSINSRANVMGYGVRCYGALAMYLWRRKWEWKLVGQPRVYLLLGDRKGTRRVILKCDGKEISSLHINCTELPQKRRTTLVLTVFELVALLVALKFVITLRN